MKKLPALTLAAGLLLAPLAPATAAPTAPPSLAEHMGDDQDAIWDKLQSWLEDWHDAQHAETPAPTPTATASPEPTATETPTPEPTAPSAGEGTTGGSGGSFTNRIRQSFTSNGLTSNYHLYAEGLDPSKPIGILMYADGSGGSGFDRPTSSYLIGGSNGLAAVAKRHNMILVVPEAPAPGCDRTDNCWYDRDLAAAQGKAKWASDLMTRVKGEYNIDNARVIVGGYSSGAQFTTQTFLNAHGEDQSVDLGIPISYGGAPRGGIKASEEWKDDVVITWDTGTNDEAYTTASYGARGGYNEYTRLGFTTDNLWVQGEDHSRTTNGVGLFGGIVDREIQQHLK